MFSSWPKEELSAKPAEQRQPAVEMEEAEETSPWPDSHLSGGGPLPEGAGRPAAPGADVW